MILSGVLLFGGAGGGGTIVNLISGLFGGDAEVVTVVTAEVVSVVSAEVVGVTTAEVVGVVDAETR